MANSPTIDMRCPCCNQPLGLDGQEVVTRKRLPAAKRQCPTCKAQVALLASAGSVAGYYYTATEVARG